MTNWRVRAASAALLVVMMAVAIRLADELLAPLFVGFLLIGGLCGVYLILLRRR